MSAYKKTLRKLNYSFHPPTSSQCVMCPKTTNIPIVRNLYYVEKLIIIPENPISSMTQHLGSSLSYNQSPGGLPHCLLIACCPHSSNWCVHWTAFRSCPFSFSGSENLIIHFSPCIRNVIRSSFHCPSCGSEYLYQTAATGFRLRP